MSPDPNLAFQIGRRRAVDLKRRQRVAAKWTAITQMIDLVHVHSAESCTGRKRHALRVLEAVVHHDTFLGAR